MVKRRCKLISTVISLPPQTTESTITTSAKLCNVKKNMFVNNIIYQRTVRNLDTVREQLRG